MVFKTESAKIVFRYVPLPRFAGAHLAE
ncbi:hypothetical protein FP2506_17609 [Fulvimarina pelagi HTCC2506]|uniref:Uncharacterized protein n=1 Tax=Fulvimarina pelagi HTCC2506 TaxID=314231 RepID=Q0FY26_9HYPH|nr:hypothetical protein FP2506_17609 [Fulvimarina pelagi HTCC2506]